MMEKTVCWRCGEALEKIEQPFPRLAKCHACEADLHVCRMCQFYKPLLSRRCEHEQAEPAREVDLANFCDYLKLAKNAYAGGEHKRASNAAVQLEALFGDEPDVNGQVTNDKKNLDPLKALFDDGSSQSTPDKD